MINSLSEKDIQKECENLLKMTNTFYIHIPKRVNKGYRKINSLAGFPDFQIFLSGGLSFFIELKTDEGKLSPIQAEKKSRFENLGFKYYVVRNFDEFHSVMKKHFNMMLKRTVYE